MRSSTVASGSSSVGDAEVEHAHAAVAAEQHVGGLHVAVDDAVLVRVREPGADGGGDAQQRGVAELALAQRAGQIDALDDVGCDVDVLAVLVHAAQAHDVGVAQLARDGRLAARALAQRRVVRDGLERHDLLALEVERAEDRAGAAHAEHAVDAEAVADHPGREERGPLLTGGFRHQETAPGQGVRGRSGASIGASCKGSDIRSGRRRRDCVAWGVIVVRQGNRAVLLRRVRSRRRPPDGGASAGVGSWQARRARRRRQRPRHAPDPSGGGRRRARARARVRRARLVLRLLEGRRLPLVRAGRELRGAPVERRRQGARRRALQPGVDARPGHHQGRELHPQGAGGRDDGLRAQADGQDQAAGSPALPAAGAAVPHARPAGSRSGAQEGADRQEGRRAGNRDAARGAWPMRTES